MDAHDEVFEQNDKREDAHDEDEAEEGGHAKKDLVGVEKDNINEFLSIFPQPERQEVVGMLMEGRLTR